jgi:hypothetical protein
MPGKRAVGLLFAPLKSSEKTVTSLDIILNIVNNANMNTAIRGIDTEVWEEFKLLCAHEKKSANTKLLEIVNYAVNQWQKKEIPRLQSRLDDLRQSRLV